MIFFNIVATILIMGNMVAVYDSLMKGETLSALISYEFSVVILWMMFALKSKMQRAKEELDQEVERIESKKTPEEWKKDLDEKRKNFRSQDTQTDTKEQNDE